MIQRNDAFANADVPQGFLAKLWGFFLFVVVAIVACVSKTYWAADNALVSTRLQANDVEMVVLEGSVQNVLGDLKLGELVAKAPFGKLFKVDASQSVSPPQYMWKLDGGYQPLYGVFGSLDEAEVWASNHGFEFDADSFQLVRSSEKGILVTPPVAPLLDVHVFTRHYAVMEEGFPVYAQPREDYSQVIDVYSQIRR